MNIGAQARIVGAPGANPTQQVLFDYAGHRHLIATTKTKEGHVLAVRHAFTYLVRLIQPSNHDHRPATQGREIHHPAFFNRLIDHEARDDCLCLVFNPKTVSSKVSHRKVIEISGVGRAVPRTAFDKVRREYPAAGIRLRPSTMAGHARRATSETHTN